MMNEKGEIIEDIIDIPEVEAGGKDTAITRGEGRQEEQRFHR